MQSSEPVSYVSQVPGCNEIDAVRVVDAGGKGQWAMTATASSTYAEQ